MAINADTQALIQRLHKSAASAAQATNPAQREAAHGFMIQRATDLQAVRDELENKLHARWYWLDANDPVAPDGTSLHILSGDEQQRFDQREDRTISLLHDYERMCDALNRALSIWLVSEGTAA